MTLFNACLTDCHHPSCRFLTLMVDITRFTLIGWSFPITCIIIMEKIINAG